MFNNKKHLGKICKSSAKKPAVYKVEEVINTQSCQYNLSEPIIMEKICGVMNAWSVEKAKTTTF